MTIFKTENLEPKFKHLFNKELQDVFDRTPARGTVEQISHRGKKELCMVRYFGVMCKKDPKEIERAAKSLIKGLSEMAKKGYFHNALAPLIGADLCDPNTPATTRNPTPAPNHYGVLCYLSVYPEFDQDAQNYKYSMDVDAGINIPYYDKEDTKSECECGKEKHNFTFHSFWCPEFERGF